MKFFATAAVVLASALTASAQSISDLPQCSLTCFISYVPNTGCQLTDVACLCMEKNINLISANITSCVEQSCNNEQEDLKTLTVVNGICAMNGGTSIPTPSVLPANGAASSSSSSIKMGSQAAYFTAGAPKYAAPAVPTAAFGAAAVFGAVGALGAMAL